jgi:predicted transcriptional regulator
MSDAISSVLLQLLITVLIGLVLFFVGNRIVSRRSREAGSKATTTGDLSRLVNGLNKTSSELDKILEKIVEVAQNRAEASIKLQAEMKRLEEAEEEYLVQIEILKNEPLRVVSDLLNELHPSQIRTPRHDFMLFLAGVVVSAIVSILWNLLKIGG